MRLLTSIAWMIVGLGLLLTADASGQGGGRGFMAVWSPMPVKPNPFIPPNKAHTRLSDLLAKHKGQQNWAEVVVHDHLFHGEYISMAPGAKTPRRFHQDHRIWWVVQDGQIRFTIEGQEPFIASKGFLVQVPKRLVYQLETVGDRPSLRFEVTNPHAHTMYPADETPAPLPGLKYERARVAAARGSYDDANVPYIDYNLTIAGKQKPKRNPNQFIGDPHDGGYVNVGIVNILRGDPNTQPPPQPGDRGHYHLTGPEAWFVLEGQNEFLIGDLPVFVANQGDVVYAPAQTWHRPRHTGNGMATRLAIVGYADSHVYSAERDSGR